MLKHILVMACVMVLAPNTACGQVLKIDNEEIRYADMSNDFKAFQRADALWIQSSYEQMTKILFDLSSKGYRNPIALLGNAFAGGYGVPKSTSSARMHWKRAAMLGNEFAMRSLANSYDSPRDDPSPQDSAFWSVVSNAFEDPSSVFSIGVKSTSERLAKLPEHQRTLVLITAKEMIERIKSNKARYEAVIPPEL